MPTCFANNKKTGKTQHGVMYAIGVSSISRAARQLQEYMGKVFRRNGIERPPQRAPCAVRCLII